MISLRALPALNLRHSIKRFRNALVASGIIALLTVAIFVAQAANTTNNYTGSATGSLLTPTNWSLGHVPTVSEDAVFTATTGIRTLTAGSLTVGSFNVTAGSGTFSIRNETTTSTNSTLTLGGAGDTGNGVSGTGADLLYAAGGSTFNITGPNGSSGSGVLNVALGQSGNFDSAGTMSVSSVISDGSNGFGITKTGAGTLTLSGVNTYSGNTTINSGTLALSGAGSIANSPNIIIGGGATFDVSTLTTALTLNSGQGLKTNSTASTATLATTTGKGLTTGTSSPLQFTYASGGATPLTISGAGTMTVASGNPVTVTVTGAALTVGDYTLISKGVSGTVAGTAPTSLTMAGSGLASGTSASVIISSGNLILHVVNAPLSGTYTVGVGGNFTTLTAAVAAYVSRGVSAPVTFSLTDATYASETYPITIGAATGSSATNTLTIKPAVGISPTFSASVANPLINFNGAANVIINGSNIVGGTTRDLTISNTNTSNNTIQFVTSANNNVVKNTVVKGAGTSGWPSGVILFNGATTGNTISNNTIQNCAISSSTASAVSSGIGMSGNISVTQANNILTGNTISDFSDFGIIFTGYTGTSVSNNVLFTTKGGNSGVVGIQADNFIGSTTISGNTVGEIKSSASFNPQSIGITLGTTSAGQTLTAVNNTVFLDTTSTSPNVGDKYGIYVWTDAGATANVYYNSIRIGGSGVTGGSSGGIFRQAGRTSTFNVKNNAVLNTRSNSTGTGKHYGISTSTTNLTSDYNDFFTNGTGGVFGNDGTADHANLLAWQTATLKDLNSKSADPLFTSATDLHITNGSSPASNAGTPIAGITTDIDGETRNALTPDIGADEFAPSNLVQFRSKQSGNWNATSTWETSTDGTNWIPALTTPTSANGAITVRNTHTVTVTANVNADELTVKTGGLLLVSNGVTFTIDDGTGTDMTIDAPAGLVGTAGTITNNGQAQVNGVLRIDDGGFPGGGTGTYAYDQTTGTLAFNNSTGPYGINNFNFWPASNGPQNVSVASGGIQMNVARTVGLTFVTSGGIYGAGNLTFNGLFNIFNGGFVSGSPTYGSASTLQYSTGGTYGRNGEWLAVTSGAGYPANVQLSNNTTLDMSNGGAFNNAPSQMSGSLTIDSGSKMQLAGSTPLTQPLNVLGNVNNSGNLTLSTSVGGDINVGGNWTRAAAGTFTPNGRLVTFSGSANQTVSVIGGGTETFNYLVVNKPGGSLLADISPNATGMTVNANIGDGLRLLSGGINLQSNQTSLTLSGNGGNVLVSGGVRSINGSGSVSFTGSKTVTSASGGTLSFGSGNTVSLSASVDFGANLSTINGTLQIGAGGSVNTNPPTYASGSTLSYITHTTYGRGAEWSATSGAGYPFNVFLDNSTTLDIGNGGTGTARQMAGSLTVQPGSTFQMAGTNPLTAPVTVLGDIQDFGTVTLSTQAGGDLKVGGFFDIGSTPLGVLNGNGRRLHFIGSATQNFFAASATSVTLPSLVINKPSGTFQLSVNTTVNPSANGEGISFKTAQSKLDLNNKTLTLSDGTFDSVAGSGFINNGTLILNGSGDAGTLPFFGVGNQSLNGLTVNRTGAGGNVTLGSSLNIFNTLTLTAGTVTTGANMLSLGNTATVTRTSGYVLGTEQKSFNAPASFTFDVGTANGYSPVEANSTTGTGSLSVKPTETKQPNVAGANALARYWTLNGSGITTNLTFHYLATDVVGTESNYQVVKYNGSFSVPPNQSVNTAAHTATVTGVNSFSDWTLAEASSVFGQIQFAQANTDTLEGDSSSHAVDITIQRTGGSSGAVSVNYSVADGTATSPSDYTVTSPTGTLNWADGDSADKTITITVNGDTALEPNETVSLTLSNAQGGASLGSPSSATLTITNDDAPPAALVVNTTNDNDDGSCDASHCSLREAINAANFASDANTISFAIPTSDAGYNTTAGVWTIKPASALPGITKPVTINGYTQTGASANTLTGGDDAALKIELDGESAGAGANGLSVAADSSTIRGLIINRFADAGVRVTANSCTVAGNFIGTDATGTLAFDTVASKSYGNGTGVLVNFTVAVSSGIGNTVGGTDKADRNVVSASAGDGIRLDGVGTAANNVLGNFVGTDKTGTKIKDANNHSFGNLGSGVALYDSRNNQIGAAPSLGLIGGNVIAASGEHGIEIASGASSGPNGNSIIGNFIGTDLAATLNLGNSGDGVRLGKDASENSIGNTRDGGNVIAYNGSNGITLAADAKQQNPIRNNSIHDNTGLGIDLGADGVTANDNGDPSQSIAPDADTGPNNLQNFPVITSATATGSERDITGTLKSTPNQSFFITLFVNPSCDASGNGEGQTLLAGLAPITTDANGDATFNYHVSTGALSPALGDFVTATATDFSNNTSEFSACKQVVGGSAGAIQFTTSSYTVNESDGTASITVERVGGSEGNISADFTTTDGTAHAPDDYTDASTSVQFNDGETGTKTINVSINDDSLYEGDETVSLALSTTTVTRAGVRSKPLIQPSAGTSATLTITDNETPPSFSVNDLIVSEPQSGTSNATFTVTLSGASQAPVSVNYSTTDGTASAPADYLAASGTLNFASGETSKPVSVTINADALAEGSETFTLNLSSQTSPLTISDGVGQGTIVDPTLDGQVIISEFRFRGAQGAQDEFVELYNSTSRDITVGTDDGSDGWALAAIMPDGTSIDLLTTIPAGTVIPARAHFLLADAPSARGAQGYSLGVKPDLTYDCDIDDGAGVALFRTGDTASFSTDTRLDAAGFSNLTGTLADLFREGAGLTSPGANDGGYSFVRNLTTGFPLDTNDNAHDFFFVSTDGGNYGDVPSTLGAPGPENSASPIQRNNLIKATPIDPGCTGTSVTPGDACARYRDTTPDPDASHNSALGTLSIRRKFTNTTNQPVTQLRFRVVDVTTRAGGASPPAGTADVRVRSSQNFTATTSNGGNAFIKGLTLEETPTQSAGGGLNSTLAAGTITLQTPLAASGAINLNFRLGVQQSGRFRIFVNVEAIFDSPPTSSVQKRVAPKAAAPVKMK